MFRKLWNRIREIFFYDNASTQKVMKELALNDYRSILYHLHRATKLEELLEIRKTIRSFQSRMIENEIELWGRQYVTILTKLWNAKFQYWKDKTRNR